MVHCMRGASKAQVSKVAPEVKVATLSHLADDVQLPELYCAPPAQQIFWQHAASPALWFGTCAAYKQVGFAGELCYSHAAAWESDGKRTCCSIQGSDALLQGRLLWSAVQEL